MWERPRGHWLTDIDASVVLVADVLDGMSAELIEQLPGLNPTIGIFAAVPDQMTPTSIEVIVPHQRR